METAIELGKQCKSSYEDFKGKWRAFAAAVRLLLPKQQTVVAKLAGMSDVQASQLKAICSLPPQDFAAYETGKLTFRPALEKARDIRAKETGKRRKKTSPFQPLIKLAVKVSPKLDAGLYVASVPSSNYCVAMGKVVTGTVVRNTFNRPDGEWGMVMFPMNAKGPQVIDFGKGVKMEFVLTHSKE